MFKMRSLSTVFSIAVLLCFVSGQEVPKNLDEAVEKLKSVVNIPDLGEQIKNFNFSGTQLGDVENLVKKKCEKNGGTEAYENAKKAITELYGCASSLVNVTLLKQEMEEARPKGDLDEVFKKYCRKKPTLRKCILTATSAIEPCLEAEEAKNQKIVENVFDKILNFTCFKEGDRIALFVAAKGPECIRDKSTTIFEKCANTTDIKDKLPFNATEGISGLSQIKELPLLIFDEKFCRNMDSFQTCTVSELESCEDPTPANLLDSIFNYIKKVTPCEKLLAH